MTMCGRACASLRASTSTDGRPREGPVCRPQELGPAALRAGGPASGMLVLAATAIMGSRESLSAPQALQCVPDHRSLQRSSQRGGRTCPNHSRWELDHTCGVCSSSHTANRKGSFHKCCSFGLSAGVISEKLSPTVVSSPTFGLD